MSTFGDIAEGYRRLGNGDVNYGLVYTCNAGWLDLGHLNPFNKNPKIGARNLWNAIKGGGADAELSFWYYYPPEWFWLHYPDEVSEAMKNDKKARFPNGDTGFRVNFSMFTISATAPLVGTVGAGINNSFLVRHNMSLEKQKSTALSIFLATSIEFEKFQFSLETRFTNWLSETARGKSLDSGFSNEDLVSNLVGFYVGIEDISAIDAVNLCHPVDKDTAEMVWKKYGSVGSRKHNSIFPDLSENTAYNDETRQQCRDDCIGQPRKFPAEFQTVSLATHGVDYIRLRA